MTWEDIARKLTSRKFWMAIVGLVSGLLLAYKVDAQTVETVSGVIMAGASVIAYIIGEGLVDGSREPEPAQVSLSRIENVQALAALIAADEQGQVYKQD